LLGAGEEALENGGNRFRVEEYKKPEFEVTVTTDQAALRVGEPGRARVKARYYFGAPVPGARVVYHVFRSAAAPQYRFPRPFDFLFRDWDTGSYDNSAYRGDLVSSGEARTDAQGETPITFETGVTDPGWNVSSMRYTIEAEVTDASRRTITGSGSVMATRQQFFAFLDTPQGFYARGDHVPVEVVTLDANEQPVSVTGTLKVYRRQWRSERSGSNGTGPGPVRLKETVVFETPLKTDGSGRARMPWITTPRGNPTGEYRIAFEARDAWEVKVSGSVMAWVAGAGMGPYQFLRQSVQLVVENNTVPEGGRARVLLLVDQPGATVLLTQEANDEILHREIVRLPENTRVIELPVNGRHSPNFYLQATMVRDGAVYQAAQ
ncbi:MAG TPA: hypothetical protein VK132_04710, partial [Gemmatimonadales bacterium]|nr:hypothetical protein [Gemmatimonadales bacterium]